MFATPPCRWNEARRLWGLCTNRSRDIARQALLWMPPDTDAALAAAACRWAAAFPLVLMCSLREDHILEEVLPVSGGGGRAVVQSVTGLLCMQKHAASPWRRCCR